jgi:predicted Zn-dependent peptidase
LPSSSVGIVVQAGPRFETSAASGVAHFLKSTLIRVRFIF